MEEALGALPGLGALGGALGLAPGVGRGGSEGTVGDGRVTPAVPHAIPGAEEELVAGNGRFGATTLVGEGSAAGGGRRGTTTFSSPIGRRSCSSGPGGIRSCPFPAAIACCHTAPIGNLGMRTQATRHFDCTADLHDVMRSTLLYRHLQHDRRAGRAAAPLRRFVLACSGEAPSERFPLLRTRVPRGACCLPGTPSLARRRRAPLPRAAAHAQAYRAAHPPGIGQSPSPVAVALDVPLIAQHHEGGVAFAGQSGEADRDAT